MNMIMVTFIPYYYSRDDCIKLINLGYNPKLLIYKRGWYQAQFGHIDWQNKLGKIYSDLPNDIWYSPTTFICDGCDKNCPDKKEKFTIGVGLRIKKDILIGKGGFGTVYKATLHQKEKAVKVIDITEKYRKNVCYHQPETTSDDVVSNLFSSAPEAKVLLSGNLQHENILELKEFWIQLSELTKIEVCLSFDLCYSDLDSWIKMEPFNFDQRKEFMLQMTDALQYLEGQKVMHRDVKPKNVLITNKEDPVAKLSDFGLSGTEINGLTPGYSPPEQMVKEGSVIGKTDLYALGVTIIITLYGHDSGIKILFSPEDNFSPADQQALKKDKVVQLVEKMLKYKPEDRIDFSQVRTELLSVQKSRLCRHKFQAYCDVKKLGDTLAQLSMIDRSIILPSTVDLASQFVSSAIRDQGQSGFCWAFAIAKLVAAKLRQFIEKLKSEEKIDERTTKAGMKMLSRINEDNRLVYEIVCILAPRKAKMTNITDADAIDQFGSMGEQIKALCSKTMVKREGWKMLPSLVKVVDIIIGGNSVISNIDDIELKWEKRHHPMSE